MAQVTIGAVQFDTFITVVEADEYLLGDVMRSAGWAAQDDDAKARGLVSATRLMLALPWCDTPPDPTVQQESPIPEVCAMLAADLLAKPELFADASGDSNVKVARAGSASVEFFSPVTGGPPIPAQQWDMLLGADLICPGGSGSGSVNDGPIFSGTRGDCRPLGGRWPWDWPIAEQDHD